MITGMIELVMTLCAIICAGGIAFLSGQRASNSRGLRRVTFGSVAVFSAVLVLANVVVLAIADGMLVRSIFAYGGFVTVVVFYAARALADLTYEVPSEQSDPAG